MNIERKIKTEPHLHTVTVAYINDNLRSEFYDIDSEIDDNVISLLIATATNWVEKETSRFFITQTWNIYLSDFPSTNYIELPVGPLQSVSSIKYTDNDGNESTWDSSEYIVDTISYMPRIVLADGCSFPSTTLYPSNPINIECVLGYGDSPDDVPSHIKNAIALLCSHWYENRQLVRSADEDSSSAPIEIPMMVDMLLAKEKRFRV